MAPHQMLQEHQIKATKVGLDFFRVQVKATLPEVAEGRLKLALMELLILVVMEVMD